MNKPKNNDHLLKQVAQPAAQPDRLQAALAGSLRAARSGSRLPFTLCRNPMKVTIQNGATHELSRKEVEAMIQVFPSAWSRLVKSIVLYQGEADIDVSFHPKEQIVGLYWPSVSVAHSKAKAIDALLVALAVIAERGELPTRISPSLRSRLLEQASEVQQKCLSIVAHNAA